MNRLGAVVACVIAFFFSAPAFAQNLSLRAPQWAQALVAADVTPTTGGRAMIAADGIDMAVRVTLASPNGGVARVIRYDLRGEQGSLYLRRFTGHPSTGWWLWGGDAPRISQFSAAQRTEIATLTRALMGVTGGVGGSEEVCQAGEQAYIEVALAGRASSFSRPCVGNTDAAGRLALRLSEIAGSRNEEELSRAAVIELLDADRAFATKAAADGVPAAFSQFAADDALIVTSDSLSTGRAGVAARYQNWPEGARLEWTPETARVSERGDMGWTWGNSTYIAPGGERTRGRYVSIWTRDYEGNWRFAFDAPIR
ncbi:MAG: nuclear transport factor 2 family protein [Hyphomonadaceae bacterium]|nr:nuclear transport factor 2 family protein [Hyphomonadaceae bacterium]